MIHLGLNFLGEGDCFVVTERLYRWSLYRPFPKDMMCNVLSNTSASSRSEKFLI